MKSINKSWTSPRFESSDLKFWGKYVKMGLRLEFETHWLYNMSGLIFSKIMYVLLLDIVNVLCECFQIFTSGCFHLWKKKIIR